MSSFSLNLTFKKIFHPHKFRHVSVCRLSEHLGPCISLLKFPSGNDSDPVSQREHFAEIVGHHDDGHPHGLFLAR